MTIKLWAYLGAGAFAALLIGVVLWQRNSLTAAHADNKAQATQIESLAAANASQQSVINNMSQARIDNDAIANAVADKLGAVKTRETNTQTIIEKVKQNDEAARDWSSVPLPVGLQNAVNPARPD